MQPVPYFLDLNGIVNRIVQSIYYVYCAAKGVMRCFKGKYKITYAGSWGKMTVNDKGNVRCMIC